VLTLASQLPRPDAEEGSIVVATAILAFVLIVLGAAIVQAGDFFQHRRSLQVRADAAALAGGQVFNECFDSIDYTSSQAQTDIENKARQYAGFSGAGTPYNTQFGGGSDSILFQSSTYPGGGGGGPDDTQDGVGECSDLALDVKLTDSAIPALFSFAGAGATHAHARVALKSIQSAKGSFPLAIPDVNPKQVSATFIDESTGTELTGCSGVLAGTTCTFLLTKGASANGLTPWSGSAGVKIPAPAGHLIGVRVGMGGAVASCAGVTGTAGSSCWDGTDKNQGLVEIRPYATGGNGTQPNAPVLYGVWPSGACSGSPFFSDASLSGGATSCGVGVQAEVDFGTGSTDPTKTKAQGGVKALLTATINGQTASMSPVSYDSATGAWLWGVASVTNVPVDTTGTTSAYGVALSWEEQDGTQGGNTCKSGNGNKCTGNFGTVQNVTSANDANDGPVKLVTLAEPSAPAMPPYSLTAGIHTLTVTVALRAALGVQNPPPLTALRLTGSGSRTTGVNCDGTGNSDFTNSIVNGCQTTYQINSNDVCPDPSPPAGPADCVPLKTGNLGSTVTTALNTRFNNTCPAATSPVRDLLMMLTDPSALAGQGKTQIPVTNFADFHIVGWTGGPGSCGTWPFSGGQPSGGNLWGYFLKYDAPGQVPSGQQCQLSDITPCVAVLTR
jgi:hypothetical protein